jgi:hypothetical protein
MRVIAIERIISRSHIIAYFQHSTTSTGPDGLEYM